MNDTQRKVFKHLPSVMVTLIWLAVAVFLYLTSLNIIEYRQIEKQRDEKWEEALKRWEDTTLDRIKVEGTEGAKE